MENQSLNALIKDSILKNWDNLALSDMGGINYRYKDAAEMMAKLHILFEAADVKPGDKVAICGKNSSTWAVIFLSCLTAGVVAVPILHEFKADMIHHLVNHSEAKLLFVDEAIWENLDENIMPDVKGVLYISELGMPFSRSKTLTKVRNNINEFFGRKYPYSFDPKDFTVYDDKPDELAILSYTSGSTGMSKGVMLMFGNIWSNVRFCLDNLDFLKAGQGVVNMLPLAHLYGLTVDMIHPFCKGCHLHFLTRLPSPKVILKAFAEVKPTLIITVPLILEKIIRNNVFPLLEKPMMKLLLKVPIVDDHLLGKIKEKILAAFGGDLQEIIVGGAPLNPEVEKFLYKIGFPLTVGYGMTECAPLISYAPSTESRPKSVGRAVDRMEVMIDSPDPYTVPGNILVKGMNVMKGYYKNEKATREVFPDDSGWMNTGDMGIMDEDGFIYISGRSKTMILGPSGQNIYPEEIEAKLNIMPYVNESLIIDDGGQLVALIHPDFESAHSQHLDSESLQKIMDDNLDNLNQQLPAYSKVKRYKIMDVEFEKTPKRSIKRFLYQA
ncbi:MAG: long-chain fatty acid--CoA ligase [Bacteroidales bacterium]|nr:long-chain fatty acid--CoA ligase [Bacteroidales bacterium]MBD5205618.1 long-chain fatty acid--CoA ligase [Bacteroidales bacterium]MBD5302158.1 long-chain fatty acid--CoA ligase [Bacteroides sp.]